MKWILFFLLGLLCTQAAATAVPPLPVEAFASIPDVSNVRLSPDGGHIASAIRMDEGIQRGTVVTIMDTQTGKKFVPIHTDNKKFVIISLNWANSRVLLVEAKYPAVRYGTPTTETRLVKYDLDTQKISNVLKPNILKRLQWMPQHQGDIIDILPEEDDAFLLSIDGMSGNVGENSVFQINLGGRQSKVVQSARTKIYGWLTDRQHKVRIGIYRDDTQYRIYEQAEPVSDRRELWRFEAFSEEAVWPMGFDEDPNILYVRAYHQGFLAIFKVDLTDPKLAKTLVYAAPERDVEASLIYSPLKKKVIGVSEADDGAFTYWDKEYIGLQNGLKAALPDANNYILQFSRDERRYLVLSSSNTEPGTYYFGDRDAGELYPIGHKYGQLSPELLSKTRQLNYQTRDELTIDSFLTLPKGAEAKNLPTIIFPHGGPSSYDSLSFDYWAQFFANRGYAVFQMNFRGSAGYGYDFMKAGLKGWGKEMQDDIEDGTRFLIKEGISDPARICIVGASYGGYAALMGAAMTPDLYRCAVSVAGVTDIAYLLSSSRNYLEYKLVKEQLGSDRSALSARSPVNQADKIKVPVLLIHGDKDRVVRVKHSRDMYDELKSLGKPVEYIELENGDHQLSSNEVRLTTFKALELFLAENLKNKG
jgi:dipeptidyl aminopeptidase/acylaminoacyl peptidase